MKINSNFINLRISSSFSKERLFYYQARKLNKSSKFISRPAAAKIYTDYCSPFFKKIPDALAKALLIRNEDVQVFHGFDSAEHAQAYLNSEMFQNDVFVGFKLLWNANPDIKIYTVA